jgi:uncharacterized membrane protein YraQ (UPF0718 family)
MQAWNDAAIATTSFFWKALWGFVLGYVISSLIQVLVTRQRMQEAMGETGPAAVARGGFFGFISSSCSFAALATTRSIMKKGAGLVPSLAFLLASTNLVVELGIVIAIFLGWQFVVAEYVGGLLLILLMWLFVRLTYPERWMSQLRDRFDEEDEDDEVEPGDWRRKVRSLEGWRAIASTYRGEWLMVWKDVLVGFTVAGIIAAYVPDSFFRTLFSGTGDEGGASLLDLVQNVVVGPVAAFFTFIGSMGNIPLAAVLFAGGVSFAGVMAFIFSDLVVFPVVRISAQYFGWKLALYVVGVFFAALTTTALLLHGGFALLGIIPDNPSTTSVTEGAFAIDYTFVLNLLFLAATAVLVWLNVTDPDSEAPARSDDVIERILYWAASASAVWLVGGLTIAPLLG